MSTPDRKRILVVDDDHRIADSLTEMLCKSGCDAMACYDGQSALRECEFRTPDLVISDVVMPGLNGIELGMQVMQLHPRCKVLLISNGDGSAEHHQQLSLTNGHFEVLPKPIQPLELLVKINSILCRKPSFETIQQRLNETGLKFAATQIDWARTLERAAARARSDVERKRAVREARAALNFAANTLQMLDVPEDRTNGLRSELNALASKLT